MDLFSLVASLTLDSSGFDSGTKDAESKASSLGSKIQSAMKVGAVAIGAATGAVVAFAKQSVSAYADYEQLAGGVETLFGDSAGKVMKDAEQAFKTAGMSMNEYMETSIASAASLINSLGGDQSKAADLMNMSITDMADNVNKMGTSMEAVQNAYKGFSRGNFTMLDNLALGFAGTKEGMQELLDKAEELSGVEYDISSYSDIVEAIHVVQTEMGITGTTAREASETISGSIASMKSAWANLTTALGDENANIEELVAEFTDSLVTVGQNLIPRVQTILEGIGTLITTAAQELIPVIISTIVDNLPAIIETGVNLVVTLASALVSAIPELVKAIPALIQAIIGGIVAAWPAIKQTGSDLVKIIGDGIKAVVNKAKEWGTDLIQNFIDGLKAKFERLRDTVSNAAGIVKRILGFSEPEEGPLSNFHTFAPDMMDLFTKGIKEGEGQLRRELGTVSGMIANAWSADGSPSYTVAGAGAMSMALPVESETKVINIDLTAVLDGAVVARNQYKYNTKEASRVGVPLVQGGY